MAKKYIGWGIGYELNGQKAITVVPAVLKEKACEQIESFGLRVISKEAVRRVCIVEQPGPLSVRIMEEQDWDKGIEVFEV